MTDSFVASSLDNFTKLDKLTTVNKCFYVYKIA